MVADFSFIHAADVHLDSPLAGLAAKDEAFSQLVRGATRRALANVIDLAISEGVSFVVIAGDLYDGTWKDHATGQFAVAQLARCQPARDLDPGSASNIDPAGRMRGSGWSTTSGMGV